VGGGRRALSVFLASSSSTSSSIESIESSIEAMVDVELRGKYADRWLIMDAERGARLSSPEAAVDVDRVKSADWSSGARHVALDDEALDEVDDSKDATVCLLDTDEAREAGAVIICWLDVEDAREPGAVMRLSSEVLIEEKDAERSMGGVTGGAVGAGMATGTGGCDSGTRTEAGTVLVLVSVLVDTGTGIELTELDAGVMVEGGGTVKLGAGVASGAAGAVAALAARLAAKLAASRSETDMPER
jgi:hypothetical protein